MLFGRKKSVSPYESGPLAARPRPALFQTGPSISQSVPSRPGGFGKSGSVIRLPVGAMLVAAVVFVALLILAYEVGYSRGQKNRPAFPPARRLNRRPPSNWRPGEPVPIEPGGSQNSGSPDKVSLPSQNRTTSTIVTTGAPPTSSAPRPQPDATGRVPGLNYCVVASYGKDEAERLSGFLRGKGVENIVVLTHNKKLFQVVDLRGFTAEEYRSPLFEEHRKRLRQFGREWKEKQRGPDDLKDIWVEKYTGS